MHWRLSATLTAGALAVVLVLTGAPGARADDAQPPAAGTAEQSPPADPSPPSATESASPPTTPSTTPSAAPSTSLDPPQPSTAASSSGPGPTDSRTAPPPKAGLPDLPPAPGSDGVLPAYGVDDAYWDAFRALDQRRTGLAQAQRDAAAAHAASDTANRAAELLRTAADAATAHASDSHGQVDRLASQLYQYGSPVTVVTAMLGAPEDFLGQVDTANNQDVAARVVVDQAVAADSSAAAAQSAAQTARLAADRAQQVATRADLAVRAAERELRSATARLGGLAGTAPQTSVGPDGCPTADVPGTLRGGAESVGARRLCRVAVAAAATPQAALALTWAFAHLGAAYACGGAGRMLPWRMDCSSLVSRAYHEGAGLAVAGAAWAPSTRDMVPWGGASLDPHYALVTPAALRPGDLVLYDTGGATYRHVVIYLGPATKGGTSWMLHTNACGDVAKVEPFWGFPTSGSATFLVARRVLRLPSDPPPDR